MSRKPALTDESFLAALFRPKSSPVPAGMRRSTLKATPGRSAARVRAFNRMDTLKQAALQKAGLRDAYLRGEATLADAKRKLRAQAVDLGVVKPLRPRRRGVRGGDLAGLLVTHMRRELPDKVINVNTVYRGVAAAPPEAYKLLRMTGPEIRAYAGNPDKKVTTSEGEEINPGWYR